MAEIRPKQKQDNTEEPTYFVTYIKLEPYLAQWLVHEHGEFPLRFPRGSVENEIIELGLRPMGKKDPPDIPGEGKYPIEIPFFKFRETRNNNYLSPKAKRQLVSCLKTRFSIALWTDLYRFGNIGKQKQDLIYIWMDTHDIDDTETNWLAISKIYSRKQDAYRKRKKSEEDEP